MKTTPLIFFYLVSISLFSQTDTAKVQVDVPEVIITADKFPNSRQNLAQQAFVIDAQVLKRLNAQTTADALQMTGSVMVQKSQQGGGSPVIRGFEASRVLLVIDGVRMNNMVYRTGHLQNIITVDNNILDRIEVLYGPSSTIYGSDALGGVVHMRTKNPILATDKKFNTAGAALFRYGSVNNEYTGHLDFSFASRKFGSLTSVTVSSFGDLKQGRYELNGTDSYWDRNYYAKRVDSGNGTSSDSAYSNSKPWVQKGSGYKQYDVLQKFLFKQNEKADHLINVQFSTTSNVPRYDRLAVEASATKLKDAEWYYGPQQRLLAAYEFNYKNAGFLDAIRIGANYQNIEESRHNRGFGKRFRTSRIETVNVVGVHADFQKTIKAHKVGFGAEGQFNFLKSKALETDAKVDTTQSASTRYPDGKNNMNYIAVYGTHTYTINPKLILAEGIRYNYVSLHSTLTSGSSEFFPFAFNEIKNTYHAVSGNLSLVALPGAGFRIAVLGSSGFRAPNVDDVAKIFESAPGSVIVPNNKLKPEYTINGELTVEKRFSNVFTLYATGFYTYFFNAISTDLTTFNGQDSIDYDGTLSRVLTYVNKSRAYIAGVNVVAEAKPTSWLTLYASFCYTHGRIITDSVPYPLDHIPPIYGRLGFRTNYKWLQTEFFTLFAGKKKIKDYNMLGEDNFGQGTPPDNLPGWATLNFRVGFYPVKYFGIDLGCDNITDLKYRQFASGISAPGRNFFVSARVRW
ncbi:MAG: TonB-dependent receptor [Bacteroidetes bacterium]|nr:TonB-dependent receptor [Bacteroidota bacterium]